MVICPILLTYTNSHLQAIARIDEKYNISPEGL